MFSMLYLFSLEMLSPKPVANSDAPFQSNSVIHWSSNGILPLSVIWTTITQVLSYCLSYSRILDVVESQMLLRVTEVRKWRFEISVFLLFVHLLVFFVCLFICLLFFFLSLKHTLQVEGKISIILTLLLFN